MSVFGKLVLIGVVGGAAGWAGLAAGVKGWTPCYAGKCGADAIHRADGTAS